LHGREIKRERERKGEERGGKGRKKRRREGKGGGIFQWDVGREGRGCRRRVNLESPAA